MNPRLSLLRTVACAVLPLLGGCAVGPDYKLPAAPVPAAYKEADGLPSRVAWKPARPADSVLRGKWWEQYKDPALDALEEQVAISNQNVLFYEAQYRSARALVGVARSAALPQVSASPSVTQVHNQGGAAANGGNGSAGASGTDVSLPVDASWTLDIWGAVRRSVEQNATAAQASYADLENARLSYQSALAQDYFNLHGLDTQEQVLKETLDSYQKYLQLTQNRYQSGIASRADVAQAQTQLAATRAQWIDTGIQRAQFEHAVAVLTGKPPAALTIPNQPLAAVPPALPFGIPSTLLERRPDVAAAERRVASANAAVGVAVGAFYPQLTLSATGGFESFQLSQLFSGPAFFWSVGPTLAQTLFDAGNRHFKAESARAGYDAAVATYRQTALTAFQQVEDNLAALGLLEEEQAAQEETVVAAQTAARVETDQYKSGIASALDVIVTEATALNAQLNVVRIRTSRVVTSVQLIEALGGGWEEKDLPGIGGASALPKESKAAK